MASCSCCLFMECDVNFDLPVTMWSLTGRTVGLRVVFSKEQECPPLGSRDFSPQTLTQNLAVSPNNS